MQFTAKVTIGTKPEPEYVGKDFKLLVQFSVAENHNVNEGTRDNPNWVKKSTSWYNVQAWGEVAERITAEGIEVGDFVEIGGTHKINKVVKAGEKPNYYPSYTIHKIEKINSKS